MDLTPEHVEELRRGDLRYPHGEPTWRQLADIAGGRDEALDLILDHQFPSDLHDRLMELIPPEFLRVRALTRLRQVMERYESYILGVKA